jgi:hypothetical protein
MATITSIGATARLSIIGEVRKRIANRRGILRTASMVNLSTEGSASPQVAARTQWFSFKLLVS